MTDAERRRFAEAIVILKDPVQSPSLLNPGTWSRYDDFVETHRLAMASASRNPITGALTNPGWAHFHSAFFPWHREMLYQFEELIRSIPGYDDVTIPYWDWTRDQDAGTAPIPNHGYPFHHEFIGVDGDDADNDHVKREPGAPTSPYPYAFDPEDWPIRSDANPATFSRAFAERTDAPNLPDNDSIVTGVGSSFRNAIAAGNYETLKDDSEDIHNLVHRWVGGNMITGGSPNDPVFYLHHAAIDRMWSIWLDKNPTLPKYEYTGSYRGTVQGIFPGHGLNDAMIFHNSGATAPWTDPPATPSSVIDGHTMHGNGVWYDTDLPEITLDTPSVSFGNVPEGMTHYRAVRFSVRTARKTRFRITSTPSGNFGLTPMGTEFEVDPDPDNDVVEGLVWVQFFSAGGNTQQTSNVTIQAYIVDEEGYYAATEGAEFSRPVEWTYTVNLTATKIARVDNSVALVLDRSGSMSAAAGGSSTRSALMRSAATTFFDLLRNSDEIGLVSFDDVSTAVLAMTQKSAASNFNALINGSDFDPRGWTSVGGGIQTGRTLLNTASAANPKAMVVLTDGHNNRPPDIAAASTDIDARTYAIGFGLPGQVNTAALNDITQNTGGDLVITGNLTAQEEEFKLSKYFVQILAGITKDNIVLDPQGELIWDTNHRITFNLTEADISTDVIALCPIPELLDFYLITPSGKEIHGNSATSEPNIEYILGKQVAYFRMGLPALVGDPAGSHAGKWQAVFKLVDRQQLQALIEKDQNLIERLAKLNRQHVPYSMIVKTYSNIDFEATSIQKSREPGAVITVFASLSEYSIPLRSSAYVVAQLTAPDGGTENVRLTPSKAGHYRADYVTTLPGVYTFRVRAEGATQEGSRFTREKTVTAGVWTGGDRPPAPTPSDGGHDDCVCKLLECLLSDKVLSARLLKKLQEMGVDMKALKKCIKKYKRERLSVAPAITTFSDDFSKIMDLARLKALVADENFGILKAVEGEKIEQAEAPEAKKAAAPKTAKIQPYAPVPSKAKGRRGRRK